MENLRLLYGERGEQLTADIEDVMTALESISKPSEVMIAEEDTIGCPVSVDEDGTVETLQKDSPLVFMLDDDLVICIVDEVHPRLE